MCAAWNLWHSFECTTANSFFLIIHLLSFCHITVIELSAEIATLQIAVLNTRQELKHGMKDKHILLQEASANQLDKESTK